MFNLKATMKLSNTKEPGWQPHGHHYVVTVSKGNKRFSFDFHDSAYNKDHGLQAEPVEAVSCYAGEAINVLTFDGYDDLALDFGVSSKEAKRIWASCQRAYRNFQKLDISDDELFELANQF